MMQLDGESTSDTIFFQPASVAMICCDPALSGAGGSQILMTRVNVVTGGASAVYGSDAVTGVVNFILDKNFEGVKYEANGGISDYGDAAFYQAGIAYSVLHHAGLRSR